MQKKFLQCSFIALSVMVMQAANSQGWSLKGNNNTDGNNFIGTKNLQPLIIKTNNVERMRFTRNGQIGIGTSTPIYPLQIGNPTSDIGVSVVNTFPTAENHIGVFSSSVIAPGWGIGVETQGGSIGTLSTGAASNHTGNAFGVIGEAIGSAGFRYGVYGFADGSGGNHYGLYGFAQGGSFNAAGYFSGDVWAITYNLISGRKFKTGITPLQNSLDQLLKLKPATYQFKTTDYPNMGLPVGKQMGLIADEVKQVFPELVKEAITPVAYSKDKKEVIQPEDKVESVNYTGLIPVLIASIQEQQKIINNINTENQSLKSRLAKIEETLAISSTQKSATSTVVKANDAHLEQNEPNPFNQNTVIKYYLPQNVTNAIINVTDMNGKVIKTIPVGANGNGQLILQGGQLPSGIYHYALMANGKLLDTKKMILTR